MRGRKPKPPGLSLVQGDTRKRGSRKHGAQARAARACGGGSTTTAPGELDAEALRYWRHLRPVLEQRGDLTPRDRNAFARYCQLLVSFWKLSDEIDRLGYVVETGGYLVDEGKGDGPQLVGTKLQNNPAISARNVVAGRLLQLESEFGLTPSARMRLIGDGSGQKPPQSVADRLREAAARRHAPRPLKGPSGE